MLESFGLFIEKTLSFIGLGGFPARFFFGSAVGFGVQLFLTPSISYDKEGYARPFALFSDDPNSTFFPWYIWPLLSGLMLVLFI